ncbi:MAG: hypothetical protein ACLRVB_14730, partial [Blautia sp.]
SVIGKFSELSYNKKALRGDRTAAERNDVARATRRRRRILGCRILCSVIGKFSELSYNKKALRGIAQRRNGMMSLVRPAAGGESWSAGFCVLWERGFFFLNEKFE